MVGQENVRTGRILLRSKVVDKIDRQRSAKWPWSLRTFDEEVGLDPIVMC